MTDVWDSFKGQGKMIFVATCLFFLGGIVGYHYLWNNLEFVLANMDKFLGNILEISESMNTNNKLYATWMIFQNNVKALLIIMFGGIALGILPLFSILFNGFVVGIVMALSFNQGQNLAFFLAAIVPHGIFELPVIFIGAAFGMRTGLEIIFPGPHSRRGRLLYNLKKQLLSLTVLVPSLLLAAFIETMITPLIANFFYNRGIFQFL